MAAPLPRALVHPPLWLDIEDRIFLQCFAADTSMEVTLRGRFLTETGHLQKVALITTPTLARTRATNTMRPGSGWLLNLFAYSSGTVPLRGQLYALMGIMRGGTATAEMSALLAAGYLSFTDYLAWPPGTIESSIMPPGALRSVTGTDPAAGVEILESVPTNARWLVRSVRFQLVTNATVANRYVDLIFDDGTNTLRTIPSRYAQPASTAGTYQFYPETAGVWGDTGAGFVTCPMPLTLLGEAFRIRTSTSSLQAGDNYGAPQLLLEELIQV